MTALDALRAGCAALAVSFLLAACGGDSAPASQAPDTAARQPAPADAAQARQSSAAATIEDSGAPEESPAQTQAGDSDEGAVQATSDAGDAAIEAVAAVETTTAVEPKAASPLAPEGPEPRLGIDYTLIDPAQSLSGVPGKVEVAEVFSYTCIHCARLDPLIGPWLKTLPEGAHFVRVPMAHGAFEPIARGFYAAEALGVAEQTSQGVFKAMTEERKLGAGKLDDVARIYASLGVDGEALKAAANSFSVNTQITRNQRTVARWAIEGTPTLVVAGKYRVVATGDRGHNGMLQTARWLVQRELAAQQAD